ncbi:MAG: transpeptidase family protein [Spirochaetales bacterium]|nr:transpeptidase family protein [Spirochaetales bacterium]
MSLKKGAPSVKLPWRWWAFFGFTAFLGLSLLTVYAVVMVVQPVSSHTELRFSKVERGPILDDQGRLFAVSTRQESASIWLPQVKDKVATAHALASILGLSEAELLRRFNEGPNFQYLKRPVSQNEAELIRAAKAAGGLSGVELNPEFGRSYPQKEIGASVVGYVGTDNVGLAGIEYSYNNILAPVQVGEGVPKTAMGASVWLTLDLDLEYEAQKIADANLIANKAKRINILVINPEDGNIKVWVTSPSFDPNHFSDYNSDQLSDSILVRAYEPGSVFKLFSISSFLDSGVLTPTMKFVCDGVYLRKLPDGSVIRITDLGSYGILDAQGILTYSSNVGTAQASDLMDEKTFDTYVHNWGFGRPTGISLVGETPGLLRPRSEWSARSKATISMGQEIGVSALQMITAAGGLADNGLLLKPHIVSKVVASSGEVLYQAHREPIRQVIKPEVAHEMLQMTKSTVEYGTAFRAQIDGIQMAGKTGTAQELNPATGTYSNSNYIASTMLFIPADQPRYVVYVTIEDPKGWSYLGGRIAAPMAREVAEKLIRLEGLPKKEEKVIEHSTQVRLNSPPVLTLGSTMPDLKGFAKRTLLPLLDQKGLKVQMNGDGWVVSQTPAPGTPLTPGMTIQLEFK